MAQEPQTTYSHPPTVHVLWLRGGPAQVVVGGEHDLDSADQLNQTLTDTLAGCSHLILDISQTKFIDSSIIRVLLDAKGRADATGRRFNLLLGTEPTVKRVLEITGVLTALNPIHTIEEASLPTALPDQAHKIAWGSHENHVAGPGAA